MSYNNRNTQRYDYQGQSNRRGSPQRDYSRSRDRVDDIESRHMPPPGSMHQNDRQRGPQSGYRREDNYSSSQGGGHPRDSRNNYQESSRGPNQYDSRQRGCDYSPSRTNDRYEDRGHNQRFENRNENHRRSPTENMSGRNAGRYDDHPPQRNSPPQYQQRDNRGPPQGNRYGQDDRMRSNDRNFGNSPPQQQRSGGYQGQDRGQRQQGQPGFNRGPSANQNSFRGGGSFQTERKPQVVDVLSNQFRLSFSNPVQVYQYSLEILGMEMWDANLVLKILKFKSKALELALGLYVPSGKSIYMLTELEEDVKLNVCLRGTTYTICIGKETQSMQTLSGQFNNSDNSADQSLINIIIKQAFRDTNLKQIGKTPKFFDMSTAIDLKEQKLKILQGFKASAFQTRLGCTLVLDSIFKFQCTQSCYERMQEIKRNARGDTEWEQMCRDEFQNSTVTADWGDQRQYIVNDVVFDTNPILERINYQDQGEITIAEYFVRTYNKKINDQRQPMFLVKIADKRIHLPTEFCIVDGVPDSIRKGMGMRDALGKTRINPQEKVKRIQDMIQKLQSQKSMQDWSVVIEQNAATLTTNVMPAPKMITNDQIKDCIEQNLRKDSITKPTDLHRNQWIFVHERNDRVNPQVKTVIADLMKASGQLKLQVDEPYIIQLQRENNKEELDRKLCEFMNQNGRFNHPLVVVCLLRFEKNYQAFKEVMQQYRLPSQVITTRNANKFGLSKATNILKQINSKLGGDLYHLQFPEAISNKRTMLIGIDVCHAGQQSVVGFAASTNKEMTQYYSEYLVQRKGQEVVENAMKDPIMKGIKTFADCHDGKYPTNFIIYRDGVSDAQRGQVLASEVPQLERAIKQLYSADEPQPEITVIVVNKRISQRFFVQENGQLKNPPSGCIIDSKVVEDFDDDSQFDFYLVPAGTTQGCLLPTHFYVPKNDSSLPRGVLQELTYVLCHGYFNWAGPIKVPAPVQYAHKIAEFFTLLGVGKRGGYRPYQAQNRAILDQIDYNKVEPLNKKLHYL